MKLISALFVALCPLLAAAHGDLHERMAAITARLKVDPTNAALHLQRGELERQHGEMGAALDDFTTAAKLDPGLDGVDLALGRAHYAVHDWPAASTALSRHLARHPDHAAALLLRARCLVAVGDHRRALMDFDRGIALCADPQPDDYLDRSAAFLALGQTDDALRGLDEGVMRLGPAVSLQMRAIDLEAAAGRTDAALDRLTRAMGSEARRDVWLEKRATCFVWPDVTPTPPRRPAKRWSCWKRFQPNVAQLLPCPNAKPGCAP